MLKQISSIQAAGPVIQAANCEFDSPSDIFSEVPQELKNLKNWVTWKIEQRGGKPTKPPYNPANGRYAASNDPSTWTGFEEAASTLGYDGIGFMLSGTKYAGVDFDGCVKNETVEPYVLEILSLLGSPYCEYSPSGTGLHVFIECEPLPKSTKIKFMDSSRGKYGIEFYHGSTTPRYLTVTGNKHSGSGIPKLENIVFAYLLMSQIFDERFKSLWLGDLSKHSNDHSAADLALMGKLARLLKNNKELMREMFGLSKLGQRDKWRDRKAYQDSTISKAVGETPQPELMPDAVQVSNIAAESARKADASESAESIPGSAASAITSSIGAPEFPTGIQGAALQGIFGEFVETALPYCESDVNCLLYHALLALGNLLGRYNFTRFGAERHYPVLFMLIIGNTSAGKGQAYKTLRALCTLIDPAWAQTRWKYSAASGEGLVRLVAGISSKMEDEWGSQTSDERLVLMLTEMSILLNSMNREGSNTSGYIRSAYDGDPLENNKSKKENSASAWNYLLNVLGHITPGELAQILGQIDWYNGMANRFLWAIVRPSKRLKRMAQEPNYGPLAEKIQAFLRLPHQGFVDFSPEAGKRWDEWVESLPFDNDEGKYAASQERVRPNALRTALIYACYDPARLDPANHGKPFFIEARHVEAAIEIVTRSGQSVDWFLKQPPVINKDADLDDIRKIRMAANAVISRGDDFTSSDLLKVFYHRKTSAEERARLAGQAGMICTTASQREGKGAPKTVWVFR